MKIAVDRKPGNSGPFTPECEKQVKTDPMLKKKKGNIKRLFLVQA